MAGYTFRGLDQSMLGSTMFEYNSVLVYGNLFGITHSSFCCTKSDFTTEIFHIKLQIKTFPSATATPTIILLPQQCGKIPCRYIHHNNKYKFPYSFGKGFRSYLINYGPISSFLDSIKYAYFFIIRLIMRYNF